MNAARKPGRPPRAASLDLETIYDAALALLDQEGPGRFSMRALARRLRVTPMAVMHHTGGRKTLMRALVERIHAPPPAVAGDAEPDVVIETVLTAYCRRVIAHPALTLAALSDPALIEGPLSDLTRTVSDQSRRLVEPETATVLTDALIDYTHGFALAHAQGRARGRAGVNARTPPGFAAGLRLILDGAERRASRRD